MANWLDKYEPGGNVAKTDATRTNKPAPQKLMTEEQKKRAARRAQAQRKHDAKELAKNVAKNQTYLSADNTTPELRAAYREAANIENFINNAPLTQSLAAMSPNDNPMIGRLAAQTITEVNPIMSAVRLTNSLKDPANNPYGIGSDAGVLANAVGTLGLIGDLGDFGNMLSPAAKYMTTNTPVANASTINLERASSKPRSKTYKHSEIVDDPNFTIKKIYRGDKEFPKVIRVQGNSGEWTVNRKPDGSYYFNAAMSNPIESGKAMLKINELLPPKPVILEPSSLSLDSYKNVLNLGKRKDWTMEFENYIPLNHSAINNRTLSNKFGFNPEGTTMPFSSREEAVNAMNEVNSMLKKQGITQEADIISNGHNWFGITIPNFKLSRNYKNGGLLDKYKPGGNLDPFGLATVKKDATQLAAPKLKLTKAQLEKNKAINKQVMAKTNKAKAEEVAKRTAARNKPGKTVSEVFTNKEPYNIQERFRLFPGDTEYGQVFDEYFNPAYFTAQMASDLGNSLQSGDYKGAATTAGLALGVGALGFDPLGSAMKVPGKLDKVIYPTRTYRASLAEGARPPIYGQSELADKVFAKGDWSTKDLGETFEYLRGIEEGRPGLLTGQNMNLTEYKVPFWKKSVAADKDVIALKALQGDVPNPNEYIIPNNKFLYPRRTNLLQAAPENVKNATFTTPLGEEARYYRPESIPMGFSSEQFRSPAYKYVEDQLNAVTGHEAPFTHTLEQAATDNIPMYNWQQPQFAPNAGMGKFSGLGDIINFENILSPAARANRVEKVESNPVSESDNLSALPADPDPVGIFQTNSERIVDKMDRLRSEFWGSGNITSDELDWLSQNGGYGSSDIYSPFGTMTGERYNNIINAIEPNPNAENLLTPVEKNFVTSRYTNLDPSTGVGNNIRETLDNLTSSSTVPKKQKPRPKNLVNESGFTREQVLEKASKEIRDSISKMSDEEFSKTVLKPSGEIDKLTYDTSANLYNEGTLEPLSREEYVERFNHHIDLLNDIIAKNNKSGVEYNITGLTPQGYLSFNTPAQKGIPGGSHDWSVNIQPGEFRGEIKDISNPLYYQNIPGINMSGSMATPFSDFIPRRGSAAYESINEYLKKLDLGRVKPGFNSQSESAFGLWDSAIQKGKAFGYYNSPKSVYGVMKALPPVIGAGAAASALTEEPEQKRNGGWLEKYDDGGPIQENYNDYSVSAGEGFVGEGTFNEGRDYSPAWGGQFEDGGILDLFKGKFAKFKETLPPNLRDTPNRDYDMRYLWKHSGKPKDLAEYQGWAPGTTWQQQLPIDTEAIKAGTYIPSQGFGLVEDVDDKTGEVSYNYHGNTVEPTTGRFLKPKHHSTLHMELDNWYNGTDPDMVEFRKTHELKDLGKYYQYVPKKGMQNGGYLSFISDPKLRNMLEGYKPGFMDINDYRLPQGQIIPLKDPSSEVSTSIGGGDGYPAYLVPSFKYAAPLRNPEAEFNMTGQYLGGPFKTVEDAERYREIRHDFIDKEYKTLPSPIATSNMAMGGSMPGAVGFTYARTNDPAPSEGKYAKKTLPSAENGTEMRYYQEGLDWRPRSMAEGGNLQLTKLDQLTNFTNYNTKQPGGWLDKYQ